MTLTWEGPHSGRTIEDLFKMVDGTLAKVREVLPADSVPYSRAFPDSDPEDAQAMADGIQAEHDRGNGG